MAILVLIVALVVIFIGAEAFTNALENLGQRLKISEGVTGSIFAAIATALPETMVPIVAMLGVTAAQDVREDVAIGAILGAPLMLSTIALFLMGVFAARARGWKDPLRPERTGFRRDLSWFLMVFALATCALFVPPQAQLVRATIVLALVVMYFLYLMLTIRASARLVRDGHGTEADHPLYVVFYLQHLGLRRLRESFAAIVLQLGGGFALIVLGARGFVQGVEELSVTMGVSALVLSLLIIPVATELPEKVNSILWIRRRRDTLAVGNITGAMVFQGSLLPALGIVLTPWAPRPEVLASAAVALLASGYLLVLRRRGNVRPYHLIVNGALYVAYGVFVLF
ncbi:MAG: sodium:calcium antiporter [Acidiferrobacterales bacterium]